MFTYICFGTRNIAQAARFYDATMGALGHARCDVEHDPAWNGWIGWGTYRDGGAHEIALWVCQPFDGKPATAGNGTMVALQARSWRQVDAFHAAARAHGGSCEGAPGLRLQYNPDFYAAYVRDPDGNKLAAICRGFTAPQ